MGFEHLFQRATRQYVQLARKSALTTPTQVSQVSGKEQRIASTKPHCPIHDQIEEFSNSNSNPPTICAGNMRQIKLRSDGILGSNVSESSMRLEKKTKTSKIWVKRREKWLVVLGVVLHAVYMLSIFDIYFKTPIVHGMDPVKPRFSSPAKRLVLIVGIFCYFPLTLLDFSQFINVLEIEFIWVV